MENERAEELKGQIEDLLEEIEQVEEGTTEENDGEFSLEEFEHLQNKLEALRGEYFVLTGTCV